MDLHTEDECIICYEPLGLITDIEITPCFHMLHQTCLTRWLSQSQSCPICRTSIPLSDDSFWGTFAEGMHDIPNDNVGRRIQIINFESRWTAPSYEPPERRYIPVSEPGNARAFTNFQMEYIIVPVQIELNTEHTISNRPKYQYIEKIHKPNWNHMMRMNNRSRGR